MKVTYRHIQPADEPAAISLWATAFEQSVDAQEAEYRADPDCRRRTFVAVDGDRLLAAVQYWKQLRYDADGQVRSFAYIANVATNPAAQRQGHADALLRMALPTAAAEGCEAALLFTYPLARALYERLGFRAYAAPFRSADLRLVNANPGPGIVVAQGAALEALWPQIASLYDESNRGRPFAIVRDKRYWPTYPAIHVLSSNLPFPSVALLARGSSGADDLAGYAFVRFGGDECIVGEIGAVGNRAAICRWLLSAVAAEATRLRLRRIAIYGPREPWLDVAARHCFGRLTPDAAHDLMALPLNETFAETELVAAITHKHAAHWWHDRL